MRGVNRPAGGAVRRRRRRAAAAEESDEDAADEPEAEQAARQPTKRDVSGSVGPQQYMAVWHVLNIYLVCVTAGNVSVGMLSVPCKLAGLPRLFFTGIRGAAGSAGC